MKVFLGGTCNEDTWRENLIPLLKIDYFNPVVKDWNEDAKRIEDAEKKLCDLHLYVLTRRQTGVYTVAEVVDESNKHPKSTVMGVLFNGCSLAQQRSFVAVAQLVRNNGVNVFFDISSIADYLNSL